MIEERQVDGVEVLTKLAARNTFFGLDIGTRSDDLQRRQACVETAIAGIKDANLADKARNLVYFSAGIWPSIDEIKNRNEAIKTLEASILAANQESDQDTLHRKVIAIGEGGLDHHWNPSGVDGRCQQDFDEEVYKGERELFEMQLELARKMDLPFLIHSRDAFEDTLDCLKNAGYHNGIVHCYSYGLEEAKKFLDLGWYIAFGGGVTYTKKAKMEKMKELLRYVPADRFLCETDAPYLAPVPFRGQTNTPVLIEEVYKFIAEIRGLSPEELSNLVDTNIKTLFRV
ncbi:MAG: TatD family hydrolase [Treponema sp.]|nr:TatD family hydrolase [Treponema sp.]